MPTIIMTKWPVKLDGSTRGKAMAFLQKLSADDTTPGLHVEPIQQSADSRVRTGRVDQFWRAVMFRLDSDGETHYVIHGVWPHDDAIDVAKRVRLKVNPINGLPQIEATPELAASPDSSNDETPPSPEPDTKATTGDEAPAAVVPDQPRLLALGRTREELVKRLGVPEDVADAAMAAADDDAILELAGQHEGWLGIVLVDLATGDSVQEILEKLEIEVSEPTGNEDADLITSLRQPAAQTQFAFIDDQDELRRVIEAGDFGAWRVFLHPEQRKYVRKTYGGPFRLSGGAGTGKTVVLVHRARALARRDPAARVLMTTFTTNLADGMRDSLAQLDPAIRLAAQLGQPGVHVSGIDAIAAAVNRSAGIHINEAVQTVLGEDRSAVNGRTPGDRWRAVLDTTSTDLPPEIANETFLSAEYALIVLPHRIHTEAEYLRVRRPGRGVALDRAKRVAVWALVAAYRVQNRISGTADFGEAAAIAAAHLELTGDAPADHVLVDEGQDLSPAHWQLLRALVAPGPDDLFIAEDSHQRIYGPRTVLGRYGIKIVGRSQRLTLNYRTTAQNLRYAMTVLEGGEYVDLEEGAEATGYRSARSGPVPVVREAATLGAELDLVAKHTSAWIDAGAAPETIAVLVQDQFQRDRVVSALTERSIPARAVDRERPGSDRIAVMTMHRAKGMEFSRVILTDVGHQSAAEKTRLAAMDETDRADTGLRRRSLVYVAATRARDELVVLQRT
ncbi:UvrD-helicase domain-containing protein [Occultella aeris]|uniref:DNA 3'-5' helicase n=1 Tax=Occultella aeris TaxID=2761496 RepID=A0A7M4DPM6_9MICO|nr:UvrD-helicase domain-containing protein [Occultella aeris]VZO39420.1 DNA-dependent helicase II [Occultella aeris]